MAKPLPPEAEVMQIYRRLPSNYQATIARIMRDLVSNPEVMAEHKPESPQRPAEVLRLFDSIDIPTTQRRPKRRVRPSLSLVR